MFEASSLTSKMLPAAAVEPDAAGAALALGAGAVATVAAGAGVGVAAGSSPLPQALSDRATVTARASGFRYGFVMDFPL